MFSLHANGSTQPSASRPSLLVNRTALYLERELLREFRREGHTVTAEQWAILNRLWEEEGLSQVQLAERTFSDKPNVTRMVGVLELLGGAVNITLMSLNLRAGLRLAGRIKVKRAA